MVSIRFSQETGYYDAQYSIQDHALGVSTRKIISSSVEKMFPTGKIFSSGKLVRSCHSAVSHIGMIFATMNVSSTEARRCTNGAIQK